MGLRVKAIATSPHETPVGHPCQLRRWVSLAEVSSAAAATLAEAEVAAEACLPRFLHLENLKNHLTGDQSTMAKAFLKRSGEKQIRWAPERLAQWAHALQTADTMSRLVQNALVLMPASSTSR